jgi:hypothetical protein
MCKFGLGSASNLHDWDMSVCQGYVMNFQEESDSCIGESTQICTLTTYIKTRSSLNWTL